MNAAQLTLPLDRRFRPNQHEMIIGHLENGGHLTVVTALNLYGIYALSQRVGEINRGNFRIKIKSEMIEENGKRFAKYTKDSIFAIPQGKQR